MFKFLRYVMFCEKKFFMIKIQAQRCPRMELKATTSFGSERVGNNGSLRTSTLLSINSVEGRKSLVISP